MQVPADTAVDTLIPVSLQGKDHPLIQQLLPTLLNPSMLGEFVSNLEMLLFISRFKFKRMLLVNMSGNQCLSDHFPF